MSSLKKGMFSILVANVINLILGIVSSFILPGKLSTDTYAMVKTFQLYASYAGLLHFGFVDGIYLAYGGKEMSSINKSDIDKDLSTIRIFQGLISIIVLIIGMFFKNKIIIAFSLSILPANLVAYFKYLYQAVGKFQIYSRIMYGTTISYFVLNMFYLFIVKTDNPIFYISVYISVDLAIWIILEGLLKKSDYHSFAIKNFSFSRLLSNVKSGILLTIGNLSSILLTSMDRWFIKFLMANIEFAQYSFAVSMENFLNVAVTPITVTLYNYFCKEEDKEKIHRIRNTVIIFSAFLISAAFPAKFVIELFLKKYTASISVMFILFGAQLFYIIIKGIYLNIYKARKQQDKYFTKLLIVIMCGFILNILCYLILRSKESFAIGTLVSAIIWLVLSSYDIKDIKWTYKEIIYLALIEALYLTTGILANSVIGFFSYVASVVLLSLIMLRSDFIYLIDLVRDEIQALVKRATFL